MLGVFFSVLERGLGTWRLFGRAGNLSVDVMGGGLWTGNMGASRGWYWALLPWVEYVFLSLLTLTFFSQRISFSREGTLENSEKRHTLVRGR